MEPIFHIAAAAAWAAAGDAYRGDTLESEGFIHCSTARQVLSVANDIFRGRRDLVLLSIDPTRVGPEIRYENLEGGNESFPHIYGPLERAAVVEAEPLEPDGEGRFVATRGLRRASGRPE